jgi:hypothetical protein
MKKILDNLAQFILPVFVLTIAISILIYKKKEDARKEALEKTKKELVALEHSAKTSKTETDTLKVDVPKK